MALKITIFLIWATVVFFFGLKFAVSCCDPITKYKIGIGEGPIWFNGSLVVFISLIVADIIGITVTILNWLF